MKGAQHQPLILQRGREDTHTMDEQEICQQRKKRQKLPGRWGMGGARRDGLWHSECNPCSSQLGIVKLAVKEILLKADD